MTTYFSDQTKSLVGKAPGISIESSTVLEVGVRIQRYLRHRKFSRSGEKFQLSNRLLRGRNLSVSSSTCHSLLRLLWLRFFKNQIIITGVINWIQNYQKMESCGMSLIKYILFVFNLIFTVSFNKIFCYTNFYYFFQVIFFLIFFYSI